MLDYIFDKLTLGKMTDKKKYLGDSHIGHFQYEVVSDAEKGKKKNPAVLSTLQGYATLSGDKNNKNKHYYPGRSKNGVQDSFWDKVLGDNASIQSKLKTKTFFGSSRHPGEGENPVPEFGDQKVPISHAIRDFKIDDKGVWVELDILNTPAGREIQTYVDYGSDIGISTRAFGEIDMDDDGFKTPKLDSYFFITWDLVSVPAFDETRMRAMSDSLAFDVSLISDSNDIKKFKEGLKSLPQAEQKTICDYAGLEYEAPVCEKDKALDSALDEISNLKDQIKSLTDSKEEPRQSQALLDSEKKMKDMRKSFNDKVWGMAEQINTLKQEKNSALDQISELEIEKEKLSDNLVSKQIESDELEKELKISEENINSLEEELEEKENIIKTLKDELSRTKESNDKMVEKLNRRKVTVTRIEDKSSTTVVTQPTETLIKPTTNSEKTETKVNDSDDFSGMTELFKLRNK